MSNVTLHPHGFRTTRISGFSLLELSVVLVVLGTITGVVLAGKNMVDGAKLRAIVTEAENYKAHMYAFKGKYDYYPGDMRGATQIWPGLTADGNGNGRLETGSGGGSFTEHFTFWQHMALADIASGSYTGQSGSTVLDAVAGQNVPPTALGRGTLFGVKYVFPQIADQQRFNGTAVAAGPETLYRGSYGIMLFAGRSGSEDDGDNPIMSAEDMWSLDNKSDDGKPASGKIVSWASATRPNCVTSDDATTAEYDVMNEEEQACTFLHKMQH